jgi:hypothetical protein
MQKCKKFRSPIWKIPKAKLKHLFVLSEDFVNGSSLINGLESKIDWFSITGGMFGDDAFEKTVASYEES